MPSSLFEVDCMCRCNIAVSNGMMPLCKRLPGVSGSRCRLLPCRVVLLALSTTPDAVGIDASAAAAATPKPTAETIDSNRLESEEGKNTPDVFVRKETVRL